MTRKKRIKTGLTLEEQISLEVKSLAELQTQVKEKKVLLAELQEQKKKAEQEDFFHFLENENLSFSQAKEIIKQSKPESEPLTKE